MTSNIVVSDTQIKRCRDTLELLADDNSLVHNYALSETICLMEDLVGRLDHSNNERIDDMNVVNFALKAAQHLSDYQWTHYNDSTVAQLEFFLDAMSLVLYVLSKSVNMIESGKRTAFYKSVSKFWKIYMNSNYINANVMFRLREIRNCLRKIKDDQSNLSNVVITGSKVVETIVNVVQSQYLPAVVSAFGALNFEYSAGIWYEDWKEMNETYSRLRQQCLENKENTQIDEIKKFSRKLLKLSIKEFERVKRKNTKYKKFEYKVLKSGGKALGYSLPDNIDTLLIGYLHLIQRILEEFYPQIRKYIIKKIIPLCNEIIETHVKKQLTFKAVEVLYVIKENTQREEVKDEIETNFNNWSTFTSNPMNTSRPLSSYTFNSNYTIPDTPTSIPKRSRRMTFPKIPTRIDHQQQRRQIIEGVFKLFEERRKICKNIDDIKMELSKDEKDDDVVDENSIIKKLNAIVEEKRRKDQIEYIESLEGKIIDEKVYSKLKEILEGDKKRKDEMGPILLKLKEIEDGNRKESEIESILSKLKEILERTIEKEQPIIEKEKEEPVSSATGKETVFKELLIIEKEPVFKKVLIIEKEPVFEKVPITEKKQSIIEKEQSIIIEKEQSIIEKKRSIIEKEQSIIEKEPPIIEKEPPIIGKEPPIIEKEPAIEEVSSIEAKPAFEKASSIEEEPVFEEISSIEDIDISSIEEISSIEDYDTDESSFDVDEILGHQKYLDDNVIVLCDVVAVVSDVDDVKFVNDVKEVDQHINHYFIEEFDDSLYINNYEVIYDVDETLGHQKYLDDNVIILVSDVNNIQYVNDVKGVNQYINHYFIEEFDDTLYIDNYEVIFDVDEILNHQKCLDDNVIILSDAAVSDMNVVNCVNDVEGVNQYINHYYIEEFEDTLYIDNYEIFIHADEILSVDEILSHQNYLDDAVVNINNLNDTKILPDVSAKNYLYDYYNFIEEFEDELYLVNYKINGEEILPPPPYNEKDSEKDNEKDSEKDDNLIIALKESLPSPYNEYNISELKNILPPDYSNLNNTTIIKIIEKRIIEEKVIYVQQESKDEDSSFFRTFKKIVKEVESLVDKAVTAHQAAVNSDMLRRNSLAVNPTEKVNEKEPSNAGK